MKSTTLSRRDFMRMAGAVSGMALLAACQPVAAPAPEEPEAPAEEPAATPVPAEKEMITIWLPAGDRFDCVVADAVDPFNEASETASVEASSKVDIWNAVRPALAAGSGPDIVLSEGPAFVAEMAMAGQTLPLDPFVDQFGWDQLFVPWALDLGVVDEELHSLPAELETMVCYYNRTLFEEHGWDPPPTPLAEFEAMCEQIWAEDVIPFASGVGECRECNEWNASLFLNHIPGPEKTYQALTGEIPWTDEDFVRGIAVVNDWMQRGWWMGSPGNFLSATFDEFTSAFATGEAAMNPEGTWFYGRIPAYFGEEVGNPNEWDWVPFPSESGEDIYVAGIGSTYSINAATAAQQACAEFLTHFFSVDVQAALFADCQFAPAPINIEAADIAGVDSRIAAIFAAFAEASDAGNYGYTSWSFWPPKTDVYLFEELEKVYVGDLSPEEYMAGMDAVFQEEFEAGDVPPIPAR